MINCQSDANDDPMQQCYNVGGNASNSLPVPFRGFQQPPIAGVTCDSTGPAGSANSLRERYTIIVAIVSSVGFDSCVVNKRVTGHVTVVT